MKEKSQVNLPLNSSDYKVIWFQYIVSCNITMRLSVTNRETFKNKLLYFEKSIFEKRSL